MVQDDREKQRNKVLQEDIDWGDDSDESDEDFKTGPVNPVKGGNGDPC